MTKIKNYPIKNPVSSDKFVGSDSENSDKTVNFSFEGVLSLLNSLNGKEVISYVFTENYTGELDENGYGYFVSENNEKDPINATKLIVSKQTKSKIDLSEFYTFISDKKDSFILKLRNISDPNNFTYFEITGVTEGDYQFTIDISIYKSDYSEGLFIVNSVYDFDFCLKPEGVDPTIYAPLNSPVFTGNPEAQNPTTPQGLATKNYADSLIVGVFSLRGLWDASSNLFPTTGGSGAAGAIKKGDLFFVSVPGILAGKNVNIGDSFFSLINTPGQTASNWNVLESNIGYVPANDANVIHTTGNESKSGILTMNNNSATVQVNGLDLTQSNIGGQVIKITNATSGTAILIQNQSTGLALRVDTSGGTGMFSSASGGTAFGASLTGIANGFVAMSNATGSGGGFLYQSGTNATGPAFLVTVNAVTKLFIGKEGDTTYTPILTAIANNQTLRVITINPTFVPGAFTGVTQLAIDVQAGGVKIPIPATSTSGFSILTHNSSTLLVEKIPSTDIPYLGVKTYNALITQSSTGAPTVSVLGVNTIGVIVWTRTGVGTYIGTLTGAFTAAKTMCILGNTSSGFTLFQQSSVNTVSITTQDIAGTNIDNKLSSTSIKIEVYP